VKISAFGRCCAIVLPSLLGAAGPVLASDTPYRSESFDAAGLHSLYTKTSGGSIEVVGDASGKATVDMFVTTNHGGTDTKEIEKRLPAYHITIVREGDSLRAVSETHQDTYWGSQLNISFRVHVPRDINCTLKTSGGDVALSDVTGTQNLDTSGGGVRIDKVKGPTTASTSGGDIDISGYDGKISAHTSGGNVSAEQSAGDFDLETSGGSIELDQLSGAIAASTSGGSVRADIPQLTGALSLSTDGGDVRASIPLVHGLDLDLKGNRVNVNLVNFSGSATKEEVRGTINGGGLPVRLKTSGGNVYLSFKNQNP